MNQVRLIELPCIRDPRGNLSFIERGICPFDIDRVGWLYDMPSGHSVSLRAVDRCRLIVAMCGSFDIVISDGDNPRRIHLNRSDRGVAVGCDVRLENFSTNSVVMILTSKESWTKN